MAPFLLCVYHNLISIGFLSIVWQQKKAQGFSLSFKMIQNSDFYHFSSHGVETDWIAHLLYHVLLWQKSLQLLKLESPQNTRMYDDLNIKSPCLWYNTIGQVRFCTSSGHFCIELSQRCPMKYASGLKIILLFKLDIKGQYCFLC